MKRKYNTLNEEIYRMKSLFGESRLYGNLVEQEVVNDDTCEWFKPKQNRSIEILEKLITIADTGKLITFNKVKRKKIQELLLVLKESKKEIEGMDCEKGVEVICNPENRKKIDEGIEVIDEEKDGDDAKKYGVKNDLEELLSLLNEIKGKCDDFVNSEEETDPNVITINLDNPVEECPPVDDDGCSDIGEWEINNYIKSPLEIHLLFGVNKTGTGSCGAPKKKRIPEDLTNSITSIVDVGYPSMWEEGHIEFCKTQKFPEVTNITNRIILNGSLENFNEIFPKLKSVNEVVLDDLSDDTDDDILDLDILKDVDIEYLHIGFSKLKDGWEEKLNKIEKISVNELESDIEDKLNELGWGVEVEGDEEYSSEYYVNPKNKVQELPQVTVTAQNTNTEVVDNTEVVHNSEVVDNSEEKPKMMVDDEEKDIIYTNTKMNKNYNIGKFVYDKKKKEFKIKSKFPFYGKRTGNLVKQMEDAFWKTLSKWYDKPLNSDNTTLDIINDKKFKVKIK